MVLYLFQPQKALYPINLAVTMTNGETTSNLYVLGGTTGEMATSNRAPTLPLAVRTGAPLKAVARQGTVTANRRVATTTNTKWALFEQPAPRARAQWT